MSFIHVKEINSKGIPDDSKFKHVQMKTDKPWIDTKCKQLLKDYKTLIHKFNCCKSTEIFLLRKITGSINSNLITQDEIIRAIGKLMYNKTSSEQTIYSL